MCLLFFLIGGTKHYGNMLFMKYSCKEKVNLNLIKLLDQNLVMNILERETSQTPPQGGN